MGQPYLCDNNVELSFVCSLDLIPRLICVLIICINIISEVDLPNQPDQSLKTAQWLFVHCLTSLDRMMQHNC